MLILLPSFPYISQKALRARVGGAGKSFFLNVLAARMRRSAFHRVALSLTLLGSSRRRCRGAAAAATEACVSQRPAQRASRPDGVPRLWCGGNGGWLAGWLAGWRGRGGCAARPFARPGEAAATARRPGRPPLGLSHGLVAERGDTWRGHRRLPRLESKRRGRLGEGGSSARGKAVHGGGEGIPRLRLGPRQAKRAGMRECRD